MSWWFHPMIHHHLEARNNSENLGKHASKELVNGSISFWDHCFISMKFYEAYIYIYIPLHIFINIARQIVEIIMLREYSYLVGISRVYSLPFYLDYLEVGPPLHTCRLSQWSCISLVATQGPEPYRPYSNITTLTLSYMPCLSIC